MLLDIVIDSDSIIGLFKMIFKLLVVFTLCYIPLLGFIRAFVNFTEYNNITMGRQLFILSSGVVIMYIAVYYFMLNVYSVDIVKWFLDV